MEYPYFLERLNFVQNESLIYPLSKDYPRGSGMGLRELRIEVQTKLPTGWQTEMLIFRDQNKIKKVKEIIKKNLGFETNYLIVNASCSQLPQGDEIYSISIDTYWKLYDLADEIEFLTPDP